MEILDALPNRVGVLQGPVHGPVEGRGGAVLQTKGGCSPELVVVKSYKGIIGCCNVKHQDRNCSKMDL